MTKPKHFHEIEDGYVLCVYCGEKVLAELAFSLNGGGHSCMECFRTEHCEGNDLEDKNGSDKRTDAE